VRTIECTYFGLYSDRSTPLDSHIQYDSGHAVYAASVKCGTFFCFSVADTTGEFDDAVMHLYAD
jgi:hypothetical protein